MLEDKQTDRKKLSEGLKIINVGLAVVGWTCCSFLGLLAAGGIYHTVKDRFTRPEPIRQPESVIERVMRQYDLDGNVDNLNKEELSNFLEDINYRPIQKGGQ